MDLKALFIVVALTMFGFGAYIISDTTIESTPVDVPGETQSTVQQTGPDIPVNPPAAVFTSEDVAIHDNKDDCWTIINNTVYDITSYVPRHPGGSEILQACGVDGSSLFNQRQDTDGEAVGSGTPHSARAASQLAELAVGTLDSQ